MFHFQPFAPSPVPIRYTILYLQPVQQKLFSNRLPSISDKAYEKNVLVAVFSCLHTVQRKAKWLAKVIWWHLFVLADLLTVKESGSKKVQLMLVHFHSQKHSLLTTQLMVLKLCILNTCIAVIFRTRWL